MIICVKNFYLELLADQAQGTEVFMAGCTALLIAISKDIVDLGTRLLWDVSVLLL